MKKLMMLAALSVLTPCVFAQSSVNTAAIQRAAKAGKDSKAARVETLSKRVLAELESFRKQAYQWEYYEANYMFQSMDGLRESYMALRAESVPAARKVAPKVNEPVFVANGRTQIKVEDYLRMETVSLWQSEQVKFDAFHDALAEDLAVAKAQAAAKKADSAAEEQAAAALPEDFKNGLESFRAYVQQSKTFNSNFVLQSMMNAMDAFNANLKKDPKSGPAMAKEFVKPIQAGWGTVVDPVAFINDHACEVWPIQEDLYNFRDQLVRLSR